MPTSILSVGEPFFQRVIFDAIGIEPGPLSSLLYSLAIIAAPVLGFVMIVAMFSESRQIVLKDQVTGGGSLEELEEQQRIEMRNSKQQAKVHRGFSL